MIDYTEIFEESKNYVPGGVHSPVRSFKGLDKAPVFFKEADGAIIVDMNDKPYIDFCMSFGPLILGHKNHLVLEALTEALNDGWSYGACEPYSLELAKFICNKIEAVEKIRFVNSGTEAVMSALRLTKAATGKNKILKFNGCYHGHVDSMLIKAGSGLAGEAQSSSAGVSEAVASETLILELGDTAGVEKVFKQYGDDLAGIIIEPLPANNGLLIPNIEFLNFLREITQKNNSLLIFDEVISGFRVAFGGMSELLKIKPDLVTYGKIIGGGLPVGALGGRADLMDHLAPVGKVYQAGTLSANPLAMRAGLATLKQLDHSFYEDLKNQTNKITDLFSTFFKKKNYPLKFTSYQSLFWINSKNNLSRANEISEDIMNDFKPLFHDLLSRGIYLAPNPYEVGFISKAHDQKVIDKLSKLFEI